MLLTARCRGTRSDQALLDYFAARSVNAPVGISSVFHQCNLGITTYVMMFDMPSSEFLVVLADGHVYPNISRIIFEKKKSGNPSLDMSGNGSSETVYDEALN